MKLKSLRVVVNSQMYRKILKKIRIFLLYIHIYMLFCYRIIQFSAEQKKLTWIQRIILVSRCGAVKNWMVKTWSLRPQRRPINAPNQKVHIAYGTLFNLSPSEFKKLYKRVGRKKKRQRFPFYFYYRYINSNSREEKLVEIYL